MTTPDLTPYVDLTLDDRDPQDLVDLALADFEAKTGETGFPEGSVEALLIEALALEDAEVIYAINRLPGAMFLIVAQVLFQLSRDEGAPAWGPVLITVGDLGGRVVPAGTQVSAPLPGGDAVTFTLDGDVVIAAGASTGAGTATADVAGTAGNGFDVDADLSLLSPVSYVDRVAFTAASSGGRDRETDLSYLARAAQLGRTLTVVLVNPDQFERFATAQPGVFRARVVNDYDPGSGHLPGVDGGHVTLAVLDATGAVLSAPAKAALLDALQARASADLAVHVIDPTFTAVNVTAAVHVAAGNVAATVRAAVRAALTDYLSPLTWGWGTVVRRNDLIALMEGVPGVEYVVAANPTVPAADVPLAGAAAIATAGVLTITSEGP